MKKTNRFSMLALVGGILASAALMGCGGGDETTEGAGTANGTAMSGNAAGPGGGAGNSSGGPAGGSNAAPATP